MISVCYHVRLENNEKFVVGLKNLKKFYSSYSKKKAGTAHKLFILVKGYDIYKKIKELKKIIPNNIPIIIEPDKSCDLVSFTEFCRYRAEKYMFIINQHSIILQNNWLKLYQDTLKKNKLKVVATTASYSSLKDPYLKNRKNSIFFFLDYLINNLKIMFLKLYYINFSKYPNPHIRLNAILIKTSLWIEYFDNLKINSKLQYYEIESGKKSFYNFLKKKKEKVAIVRNDKKYVLDETKWKNFVPFRNSYQESKLIISDDHTRFYKVSNLFKKIYLNKESWR
jgi:hypothetical protein